jgi:WD40 repeat protein
MSAPSQSFRRGLVVFLVVISAGSLFSSPLFAQRRNRTSPGLILETGARTAMCDLLTFTPDGSELLAAGDDKVVRIWSVGARGFVNHRSRTLRWPIYREQRGGIFAMALSPKASRVVVGGYGIQTGFLAVLDRATGDIVHALETPPIDEVTWSAAFSPSGRYVVYGTDKGRLFRWDLGARAATSVQFADSGGRSINRVRMIAFLDRTHFISVAQDGVIREWDVTQPDQPASSEIEAFRLPELYRVVMSKDRRWLAAIGESTSGMGDARRAEVIDLKQLRAGRPATSYLRSIAFPQDKGENRDPRAIAFDDAGARLAVGVQVLAYAETTTLFNRVTGGLVHVFDVVTGKQLTKRPLDLGFRVENIAFRPGQKNQLATAGGNNHEVRLWDLGPPVQRLDEIRSPGSCLWGVAMSGNRYLAWQERRASLPTPTNWGADPWRIFDLKKRKIVSGKPKDFNPVEPIPTLDGWSIEPTKNAFVWRVIGPGRTNVPLNWTATSHLYRAPVNQIPRCYTFLRPTEKIPVPRLAVGHMWGVSLYELRPNDVRLVRLLIGHESEVMGVAPSQDGKLLVTASRDQTLAGWSLENWQQQPELGASFIESRDGKTIEVRAVDPGSPAWEAGLTEGDEIVMVVSSERDAPRGFVFDPENRGQMRGKLFVWKHKGKKVIPGFDLRQRCTKAQILDKLRNVEPGREYIFVWKHGKDLNYQLTTARQRPLWRFFPTNSETQNAGNDWVIWRWRDFYYDTSSVEADRLVGWHVNAEELNVKPTFYPLEHFRGTDDIRGPKGQARGFYRPDKIWGPKGAVAGAFTDPEKVIFPDIEPPDVQVSAVKKPGKNSDLELSITIKPRSANPKQKLNRVIIWLDDYRYPDPPKIAQTVAVDGIQVPAVVAPNFVIKREELRRGNNRITVQCYNDQGGRGQTNPIDVFFDDGLAPQRDLHALCVGINDYSNMTPPQKSLSFSKPDAEEMARVFREHAGSSLYKAVEVADPLTNEQATAKKITARLQQFKNKVKRDDWFILFLSGHGSARQSQAGYQPGSFFYACTDSDIDDPDTVLSSRQLYEILSQIKCRKLIILDTCHSGDVASNPVRDLMRDGVPWLIFSSCDPKQESNEPIKGAGRVQHGFFTECILETIRPSGKGKRQFRRQPITAGKLADSIRSKMQDLLVEYEVKKGAKNYQTPVFEFGAGAAEPVLCAP